jgi:hypothetical protein
MALNDLAFHEMAFKDMERSRFRPAPVIDKQDFVFP